MDGFDPHDGNNFPVKVKLPPVWPNMYSSSQQ